MNKKITLIDAQNRLDEIVNIMNDKSLSFDDLLRYYEEATKLLAFSYKEINKNKGKFEQLKDKLDKVRLDMEDDNNE